MSAPPPVYVLLAAGAPAGGWIAGAGLAGALLFFGRRLYSPRATHLDKWLVVALLPALAAWALSATGPAALGDAGRAAVLLGAVGLELAAVLRDTNPGRSGAQ